MNYAEQLRADAARWEQNTKILGEEAIAALTVFLESSDEDWLEKCAHELGLGFTSTVDADVFLSKVDFAKSDLYNGNLSFDNPADEDGVTPSFVFHEGEWVTEDAYLDACGDEEDDDDE